jgi:CotH kinase protein/Lamin Tail Domain
MVPLRFAATIALSAWLSAAAPAGVVINEIFYHAPDDLDQLQFIEVHNTGDGAVELAGWKLGRSIRYEFPAGKRIEANGYLVLCKDAALFKKYYGIDADGVFTGALSHGGDRIDLLDGQGQRIDSVKYKTRAPWPIAPDGSSSSLERICPTSASDGAENWAPSPLPKGPPKPGGTPGRRNSNFAERLPPVLGHVTVVPEDAAPGDEIRVEADVRSPDGVKTVELLWRTAGTNSVSPETAIPMSKVLSGKYAATIPAQKAGRIVRIRIHAMDEKGTERFFPNEYEVAPAVSVYVHEPFQPGKIPLGYVINVSGFPPPGQGRFDAPSPDPPPRGNQAYVHVDAKTGRPELFDFVNITPRGGGRKIRFHKDHALREMTTINLIFEGVDRFVLAEPLAYEVYRKAGSAACRTDFVRTYVDGKPIGYQLLIEQPNKSFLRHNGLATDGNLYKCQWFGQGLAGQHEKKTHPHEGHDDLVKLVGDLNRTSGDEQWNVIKKNFDVEQVINYFAVNMVLSHWDGYFNNYFTYHDLRTGKWTMYPWDQDKTWGFHDGIHGYEVFTDMPITFGMNGDKPPGGRGLGGFFGGGPVWWRPGGYFSKPLLANPKFRPLFLARTKEILETVYTETVMFPLIDALGERLAEDVKLRAEIYRQDPKQAAEHLRRNLDSLREHLKKRREFLLEQPEIKSAGQFDREMLK